MNAKPCPVRDCGALIRPGASLCTEDWGRLPDDLRDDLGAARMLGPEMLGETIVSAVALLDRLPVLPARGR